MALTDSERSIICSALRSYPTLCIHQSIHGFNIAGRAVSTEELADLLEEKNPDAEEIARGAAVIARERLTNSLRQRLDKRVQLPSDVVEQAYAAGGVEGWMDTVENHLGHADYSIGGAGSRTTHLSAVRDHLLGKRESDFHRPEIQRAYVAPIVAAVGIKAEPDRRKRY